MITIVNYGMGNLHSIQSALRYLGFPCVIEARAEAIAAAERLILPGVGSFARAMSNLHATGIRDALEQAVTVRRVPVLGICLGMQLLADTGTEDGVCDGLRWIPGQVVRLPASEKHRVPHIGFNAVTPADDREPLFRGLESPADFYFVHSFHFVPRDASSVAGTCEYGVRFVAAVRRGNVWGMQFHPEKSQGNGLRLLRNFAAVMQSAAISPC